LLAHSSSCTPYINQGMNMSEKKSGIIYTLTDEAPLLATCAFLPIIRTFAGPAGVEVETCDISVATPHPRRISRLPERQTEGSEHPRRPRSPHPAAGNQHHQAAEHQCLPAAIDGGDQGTAGARLQCAQFPREPENRSGRGYQGPLFQVPGQRGQSGAARRQLRPPRTAGRQGLCAQAPALDGQVEHGFRARTWRT
jgi:hypothetical protein